MTLIAYLAQKLIRFQSRLNPKDRQRIFILFLWGLGAVLFFSKINYPRAIVFDETYLIPNAQSYINGIFFQDSHPPLGRLFVALGQAVLHPRDPSNEFIHVEKIEKDWPQGVDISGYRIFPSVFGTLNPVLVFCIVLILTSDEAISFFVALSLLLDNALLTQSRFALTDSILIAFVLSAILCFTWLQSHIANSRTKREMMVWAIFGLTASAAFVTKFTGLFVFAVLPFYFYKLWSQDRKKDIFPFIAIFGLASVVVFILVWQIHFSLLRTVPEKFNNPISDLHIQILNGSYQPSSIQKFIIEVQDSYHYMIEYHKNVPSLDLSKPDEIGSPWYYWPFGGRAISYRWESGDGNIKIIYLLGNLVSWLISLIGIVAGSAILIADLLFGFLSKDQRFRFSSFVLLYWVYMMAISMPSRVLYLYHYLPALIIGSILFGVVFAETKSISRKAKSSIMMSTLSCIAIVFFIYSPFVYYTEISLARFNLLDIWPAWGLRCPNC